MKKIVLLILCVALFMALPVVAFAEESTAPDNEVLTDLPSNSTSEEENAPEGEISAPETIPETETEEEKTIADTIVSFITDNYTESSLITLATTVVVYLFYEIKKNKSLKGSIGILNNNAVQIAENSTAAIKNILDEAKDIAAVVNNYKNEIAELLGEIKKSAEEKENLEKTLHNVQAFLSTSKLATIELSNEVAELLILANIPNSKKDELYARHLEAIKAITIEENAEEINNDGEKA